MKKPQIKSKMSIFFFILFICFDFSKQQCSSSSCTYYPTYCNYCTCKPRYGYNLCYSCSTTIISGKYYSIDSNGNCNSQCIGDKLIKNSNEDLYECTSVALLNNNYYRLGDIFYNYDISSTTNIVCTNKVCSCKEFFYYEVFNSKKIYKCFPTYSNAASNGYRFYNYITKEVFPSGCPEGFNIERNMGTSYNAIRCSDKCINNEYQTSLVSGDAIIAKCIVEADCKVGNAEGYIFKYEGNGIKECLKSCPSGSDYVYESGNFRTCYKKEQCYFIDDENKKCYFDGCPSDKSYYNTDSNVKRCLKKDQCLSKGYKYFIDEECRDNCDGYYKRDITLDTTVLAAYLPFTKCYETLEKAQDDTNVRYYCANLKRCWDEKPHDIQYYVKKEETVTTVTTPVISYKRYELVEECETFYYKKDDLFHCTDDCKTKDLFFLRGDYKCRSSCSEFHKYYYDPNNFECVDSCKGVQDYGFQNAISSSTSPIPQACLRNCDSGKFYNYDSNVCITNCSVSGNTRLYYRDGNYVCYPSCIDIPDGSGVIGKYLY